MRHGECSFPSIFNRRCNQKLSIPLGPLKIIRRNEVVVTHAALEMGTFHDLGRKVFLTCICTLTVI